MSTPSEPGRRASGSSDPAELRRDIEQVRGELAETVDALADKVDIKSRAQDKAQTIKAQATEKADELRAQATARAPQLTETVQQKAQQAQRMIQDKPGVARGVALAVLGLLILRRRRRRRHRRG